MSGRVGAGPAGTACARAPIAQINKVANRVISHSNLAADLMEPWAANWTSTWTIIEMPDIRSFRAVSTRRRLIRQCDVLAHGSAIDAAKDTATLLDLQTF